MNPVRCTVLLQFCHRAVQKQNCVAVTNLLLGHIPPYKVVQTSLRTRSPFKISTKDRNLHNMQDKKNQHPKQSANEKTNKQTKTTTTPRQQASVQLQLVDFTRSCPAPIPGHNNVVRTKIKKIRYPYKRAHCTRAACLSGGGGKGKKRYYPSPDA